MTTRPYSGGELDLFAKATNWKRYLESMLREYVRGRVLEVGAGIGATTTFLCDGKQDLWICLEPDRRMSIVVQTKIERRELPSCCRSVNGAITDLEHEARFDAILYIDVLEHIADDAEELRMAVSHLAPGGHLIVLGPAHQYLWSPFDAAVGHLRRYKKEELALIAPQQLRLVRMSYLDSLGMLASLVNRFLLRERVPTRAEIALWDRLIVPLSRCMDRLSCYRWGKSVLGIWCFINRRAQTP